MAEAKATLPMIKSYDARLDDVFVALSLQHAREAGAQKGCPALRRVAQVSRLAWATRSGQPSVTPRAKASGFGVTQQSTPGLAAQKVIAQDCGSVRSPGCSS
jgi:hypothetical protein